MNIRYHVDLTGAERDELNALLSGGKHPARKLKRAQILLAADAGVAMRRSQNGRGRRLDRLPHQAAFRRSEPGSGALSEEPRPGAERKLTGKEEALLIATACSKPPAGRARWTLELLAGEMVRLTDHESLSRETVRRRLAENDLKPWRKDMWCIPKVDAEYVARMEDVLDLYAEAPDPKRPVVCFDESPTQLIGEVRQPIPAKPGQLERYDCEYRRNGTANLFVFLDAHRPWRKVKVTDRRTAEDFAAVHARARRCPLPRSREDPRRARQSLHPLPERALPDLPAARGTARATPPRVPLHAKARQLAQHGRDRDRRPAQPVPRPPHRQPQRLVAEIAAWERQRNHSRRSHQLDVHRRKSPRQNGPRLPNPSQRVIITVQRY